MGDFGAMFGAPGVDGGAKPSGDSKEKSNKLWPWGTAPAQLLNACGSNHISDADLPSYWKVLAQGNKSVPFFHEGVLRSTAPGCRRVPRCWGYPVVRDGRAVGFTLHMSSRIHF